jgi:D-alanyl-D-alanine carboxypeptidase
MTEFRRDHARPRAERARPSAGFVRCSLEAGIRYAADMTSMTAATDDVHTDDFPGPDPAERSAFNRLFYRNRRPTWLGHWVSQFFCWWARVGLPPRSWVALHVRDRVSGRLRQDAVVIPSLGGERYVVSMFGTISDWVRNLEAANGDAAISHGGMQLVRLVVVPPEERAPILQEYVRVASSGRKHFPLPVGAPLADFAAIASRYPVYRIEVPASRRPHIHQGQRSDAARVESYLTALTATSKIPGIQYRVMTSTRVLYEHASGWADICRRIPADSATTMMAYSMSKTITAAAALQLVENGQVGLDDPVERYLGSLLPYGPRVTIRQLISHTSGIPNPIPLRWVHPADRHETFDEEAALAAVLHKHPRLSFAPGSRYAYSNIGYWLLGKVIERASAERFSSYVIERILRPLAIAPRDLGFVVLDPAHHATGYLEKYSLMNLAKGLLIDRALVGDYSDRWLAIRSHYLNGPAFGGLVGTAAGFGAFLRDQLRQRSVLFNDTTRQLFYTQQQTTRGASIAMTLGWHIGDRDGRRFYYKEGGGGGFHCMMRLYPRDAIGTVAMTNATGCDVRRLMDTIDATFLEESG